VTAVAETVLIVLNPDGDATRVDPAAPVIRADDLAVLRGEAVFETLRTFGGRAFQLPEHLARMRVSAARVEVDVPAPDAWRGLVNAALAAFGPEEGQLRLVATKGPRPAGPGLAGPGLAGPGLAGPGLAGPGLGGPVAFGLLVPVPATYAAARDHGISAVTLTLGVPAAARPVAPWLLGGVKATSYAVAMAGLRAATEAGAADAVWVSTDGEILEAPTATVVMITDGVLVTPPATEVGILPGTTVRAVAAFAGGIVERRISVAELRQADEVLLCSSIRGVAGLVTLDGAAIGSGSVGPVTARLRDALEEAVRSGREIPS
jgi:4-amino-4-deoxychorismate lyase